MERSQVVVVLYIGQEDKGCPSYKPCASMPPRPANSMKWSQVSGPGTEFGCINIGTRNTYATPLSAA